VRAAALALLVALLGAGCDDTRGIIDGGPRPDGSVARPDGAPPPDGSSPDGSSPSDSGASGDAGGVPAIAVCQLGCAVVDDCVTASAAFDVDNYRCESGACRYTGCVSDDECRGVFGSSYGCRDAGSGVPTCVQVCASMSDCGTGTPAFDADNYSCVATACRYTGCSDDAECEGTFGAAYGCFDLRPPDVGVPIPTATRNCVRRCAAPADCATDANAFDAPNWECASGACRYLGCGTDAQCQATFASGAYVCR
jgi:hypothetical protein